MATELEETTMMERERGARGRGREIDIGTAMTERGREMLGEPVFEETTLMERTRERGGRGRDIDISTAMTERGRKMLGEPVFKETMLNSQLSSDEPFISSSLAGNQRQHMTSPPTENYNFSSPPTLSDLRSPPTLSDEFTFEFPPTETHIHQPLGPLSSLGNISTDPLPTEILTNPPTLQSSVPLPPAKLTGPPQRPMAPQPSAKSTGPSVRPVAPQQSAKSTGPSPQRSVAPQPSAKSTGPPQRSVDVHRVPLTVSNKHNQDTEFLDVS